MYYNPFKQQVNSTTMISSTKMRWMRKAAAVSKANQKFSEGEPDTDKKESETNKNNKI